MEPGVALPKDIASASSGAIGTARDTQGVSGRSEAVLGVNLAALGKVDGPLAEIVSVVEVPETVEPAVANDGSATFRIMGTGGRREWLGGSSVPEVFAEANMERIELSGGNLAMEGIGNGADALMILERMSPYQALVVVEREALGLQLAFRLRDFSQTIERGQLVVLLGEDAGKLMEGFFLSHRGYNLIQRTVTLPWRSEQANHGFARSVNEAMERCLAEILGTVNELGVRQQERDAKLSAQRGCFLPERLDELRVTNCTNNYSEADVVTSRDGLWGLSALGAKTEGFVFDRPDVVSSEYQLERIAALEPQLILLVDAVRGDVSPRLPESSVCATLLREAGESLLEGDIGDRMAGDDFIFAGRCEEVERLTRAGVIQERVFYLPRGVNTQLYRSVEVGADEMGRLGSEVAVVGERCSTAAESYRIKLPSHQKLWKAMIEEIRRAPEDFTTERSGEIVERAQRCGIELRDEDVIEHFRNLVERHLGEAVVWDCYCKALVTAGVDLRVWAKSWGGRAAAQEKLNGWKESAVGDRAAGCVSEAAELNQLYNSAKIFVSISVNGQVEQQFLEGIAAGGFFLVKRHRRDRQPGGLGDFFELDKEIFTFDTERDLVAKVKYYLGHEQERREIAEAACARCREEHSMKRRMGEMVEKMQLVCSL